MRVSFRGMHTLMRTVAKGGSRTPRNGTGLLGMFETQIGPCIFFTRGVFEQ